MRGHMPAGKNTAIRGWKSKAVCINGVSARVHECGADRVGSAQDWGECLRRQEQGVTPPPLSGLWIRRCLHDSDYSAENAPCPLAKTDERSHYALPPFAG